MEQATCFINDDKSIINIASEIIRAAISEKVP